MALNRNYKNIKPLEWIDDDHFVGTVDWDNPRYPMARVACYGWSKGAGWFIYEIKDGHIEKLGSVKRQDITRLDTTV